MVSSFFCVVICLIVYVDVLLILNFLVNYFMLLSVKKISRNKTTRLRILIASLIGGLSALLLFAEKLGIIMTLLKVASAFLMCLVAFGLKPIRAYLKSVFWLFAICFLFGGVVFAIYYFFETDILLYSNGIIYFDVDITFLVICSVLSYLIITLITHLTDKKAPSNKEYYVTIESEKRLVSARWRVSTVR